jgi:MOSC domain-containing protein YiiM
VTAGVVPVAYVQELCHRAKHFDPLAGRVIEISEKPHLGCKKFASRFGRDALRFVNSAEGRSFRLRGVNTRVIVPGTVRTGDAIRKM